MSNAAQLLAECEIDSGVVVTMKIGPDRGIGVEKFAATRVAKQRAFAGNNDDRFAPAPLAHLCVGVPDAGAVQTGELARGIFQP